MIKILQGDCRDVLKTLPAESVHCCVTSPPYFGLRDYGVVGQIGLEPTMEGYVSEMVGVFREVRRVLRSDGTCWINLGDMHRHKQLLGVPWRVAFALQDDGWWLRSDIVWSKPNPMPESVTDRPTRSHEYVFLLAKSERYFYDADAIKEPMKDVSLQRLSQPNVFEQEGGPKDPKTGNRSHRKAINNQAERLVKHEKWKTRFEGWDEYDKSLGRNRRSVWEIATSPFPEAHFATFPPALIEPCILAGCPKGGTVLDPFAGAGTTGLVADRLQREAVLIEINPEYAEMARRRVVGDAPLLAWGASTVSRLMAQPSASQF